MWLNANKWISGIKEKLVHDYFWPNAHTDVLKSGIPTDDNDIRGLRYWS